eukprot:m.30232 g.30232  ORF g.30232 m.30232 type:complete len:348 (+) comp8185_c0_seq1:263-1306(+)
MATAEELQDYFQTTFHERLVKHSVDQDFEASMLTPSTRLLQKQREMKQIEESLLIQKQEHAERMIDLERRQDSLKEKEKLLAESLIRFDHFLKENDARRKRALRKAHDERQLCIEKDSEIENLRNQLADLRDMRDRQRLAISKMEIYDKYMKSVLESTAEFSEKRELIDRYTTLDLTNKDLVQHDHDSQEKRDQKIRDAAKYKESHRIKMLSYSTKLGELTSKKERAEKETLYWEHAAQAAEQNATNRTLLLGRIRMATANLFALVNAHTPGAATLERLTVTEKQLDKIQVFIKDLADVVQEFEENFSATATGTSDLNTTSKTTMGSTSSASLERKKSKTLSRTKIK